MSYFGIGESLTVCGGDKEEDVGRHLSTPLIACGVVMIRLRPKDSLSGFLIRRAVSAMMYTLSIRKLVGFLSYFRVTLGLGKGMNPGPHIIDLYFHLLRSWVE